MQQRLVLADIAYSSRENQIFITSKGWFYVMGLCRNWKEEREGKSLKEIIESLAFSEISKTWTKDQWNRRRTYWINRKKLKLKGVGEVTILFSRCRRNVGPKQTKTIVTNLPSSVATRTIIQLFIRRWNIEVFFREVKDELGMGQYQIQGPVEKQERALAISVFGYLFLLALYGEKIPLNGSWSIHKLRILFIEEVSGFQINNLLKKVA